MEYPIQEAFYHYDEHKAAFVKPVGCDPARWTMLVLEQGSFAYRIGSEAGTVSAGQALACPPGSELERRALAPMTVHYLGFVLFGHAASPHARLADWVSAGHHLLTPVDRMRCHSTLRHLSRTLGKHDPDAQLLRTHYINDLWLLHGETFVAAEPSRTPPDAVMREAKRWLDEHALRPLRLEDLALRLGLSRVAFTRQFSASYGSSPKAYLTELRLEQAKRLLLDTDYTLDHIAGLCGYDNGYYFSRVFVRQEHIRPSEYRRTYRL
ncbi:helix-turn-helix transcriptional regulator [Paenibacillus sp. IB182496]|uniref:Helix-turn-helix transcriptional regulator n=1 Tax=Paenibacillus sabuli TaxID=2772509 RepID=A0A927BZU1_9BACL|nr:AraC family transcriptional regulator [Paenibacillus sabuli]MBD2848605.1 helix-turn-helix transcriptional regulator [Paenibacillus sabuli]